MTATHEADCYHGKLSVCSIRDDAANPNMVFALVVKDHRYWFGHTHYLNTGSRVWAARQQMEAL